MVGRAGILATIALMVAAACGGTATPSVSPSPAAASAAASAKASAAPAKVPTTVAELAAYQGADRQKILEDGAKKEGALVWYTSLAGAAIGRQIDAFTKKYPFVKVEQFRGNESQLVTKATQEFQAGKQNFDVLESQITAVQLLYSDKIVTPYYSPSAAGIPDDFKTKADGALILSATDRFSLISFGYNTDLIPANAVPKTIDDLMNPALQGKLAVTGTNTGQRWLGSILHVKGEDKGKQWLTEFATKQKVTVQQVSGQALLDLIAKGEVAASPTIFRDHAELAAAEKKAHVKWVPLEPVVGNTGQDALAAKAPHPHAALLFIDFLLGKDGAAVYHDNRYETATDKLDFKVWVPEHGMTTDQIEKDTKLWSSLFKSTFR